MRLRPSIPVPDGGLGHTSVVGVLRRSFAVALLSVGVLCGTTGCSSPAGPPDRLSSADGPSPDSASPASDDASPDLNVPDGRAPDSASVDATSAEAAPPDADSADASAPDVDSPDANAADADPSDAGPSDDGSATLPPSASDAGSADTAPPDGGAPTSAPDSGAPETGSPVPPPSSDGGAISYTTLPLGAVNLSVSVQPAGPVYEMECLGDNCTDTQQVVISQSSVSPVTCSFAGTNPGQVTATCSVTVAYPYPSTCVTGDPGNCTWVVGLEPTWGPVSGIVAADGTFSLTFGAPYDAQDPVGAVLDGDLLPILGGTGTALGVSLMGYTGADSGATAAGAAPICGSGSCGAICYIGGSAYASGYADPAAACQSCQPGASASNWSTSPLGTSCGNAQVCVSGACTAECVIGGMDYAPGTPNPANACQTCTPASSTSAWSPVADGVSCGGGDVCTAGSCGGACTIGGTTYAAGAANPSNACQSCQPASSSTQWSDVADGSVCGANAGDNRMLCQYGTCTGVSPGDPNYCAGPAITAQQAQAFFSSGATTATIARYQTTAQRLTCGDTSCGWWDPDTNMGPWLGIVPPSGTSIWLPQGGNVVLTLSSTGSVSLALVSDPVTTFGGTLETTGYTQSFSPALGSGQALVEQSFGGWPFSELYFADLNGPGNQSVAVTTFMTNHCVQVIVAGSQVNVTDAGEDGWDAQVIFFATF